MNGHGDPLGIMQEIEVWPYAHMVYAQPKICPGEWDAQNPLQFLDTNGSLNLGQTTRRCQIVDQRKKSEKKETYRDLTKE